MDFDRSELLAAAKKVGIAKSSADELWDALHTKSEQKRSKLDLPTILYYFGALVVIIGMGWIFGDVWAKVEGRGIFFIALIYILIFFSAGAALWKRALRVPGGLCITVAVSLVPLLVYGLEKWSGLGLLPMQPEYPEAFSAMTFGGKALMQGATLLAGLLALRFYRFPLLTVPIYLALWFFLYNVLQFIGSSDHLNNVIVGVFGLLLIAFGYFLDLRTQRDFAFWSYLTGIFIFSISLIDLYGFMPGWLYALLNIAILLFSVLLQRALFIPFGALGLFGYFVDLFYPSTWFPISMSLVGIVMIVLGLLYHKKRHKIDHFILHLLPVQMRRWFPPHKK